MKSRSVYYTNDGIIIKIDNLSYDDLVKMISDFYYKNNRVPSRKDFTAKNNLPYREKINEILKLNNKTYADILESISAYSPFVHSKNMSDLKYSDQLEKLKQICSNLDIAPHHQRLSEEFGLMGHRWFVKNCKNPMVSDYNSFMEYEVGIIPNYQASKEFVERIIRNKQSELGRNLLRKDFDDGLAGVSTSTVFRIWGSIRKMREDLGIEKSKSVGGHDRKKSIDEIMLSINNFFNHIIEDKRNIFTIREMNDYFENNNIELTFQTANKRIRKEYKITINDLASEKELSLNKPGRGMVQLFSDGEKTFSYYEFLFSSFLRKLGFVYEKDYFRDIKYSELFEKINGWTTIDYVIRVGNRIIYIEVAGLLRDYKNFYIENREITSSKSKEKYRKTLLKKEIELIKNNAEYYFLFPDKYNNFNKIIQEEISDVFMKGVM